MATRFNFVAPLGHPAPSASYAPSQGPRSQTVSLTPRPPWRSSNSTPYHHPYANVCSSPSLCSDPTTHSHGPFRSSSTSIGTTSLCSTSHGHTDPITTAHHHSSPRRHPSSWPPSTGFEASIRYTPLPAHSRADFVVAPQPTSQVVHATAHVHHWGGVQQHPLQAPSQPFNQTTQKPAAPAPPLYGHLIIPKIERTYDRNILANAWRQVVDDWEGKDPRRCPVPLCDWDATWHKKTPQAVVYHQRKVIAEEFINE